jgi:Zn-dependent metalloprotease
MKKLHLIISTCFAIFSLLISYSAIGQTKEVIQSNFVSPFMKKENSEEQKTEIIKPSNELTAAIKKANENYTIDKDGSYTMIYFTKKNKVAAKDFFQQFTQNFNLTENDSFNLIRQENDNIGFTHYRYQQLLNGIPVIGGEYLLHEKNSILVSANGNIYNNLVIDFIPKISNDEAIQVAIKNVGAVKYQWEVKSSEDFLKSESNDSNATYKPKAELVIAPINGIYTNENFRLCYKINIASEKPYDILDVFVDAHTGEVINKISKIAHTEVTGSASTLYSGTKSIKMDSYSSGYRLRESTRPIQTFNMLNGTNYSNAVDFSNSTTTWNSQEIISNGIIVSTVNNNWEDGLEYAILGGAPDIYIVLRDANSNIVYTTKSNPINNTFPPVAFNLGGIVLTSSSYQLTIWDYDDGGTGDDLLGTFTFSAVSGNYAYSSNGTTGTVYKSSRNNPALDVHFAMEKTYDFYLNQLGRNSFDNAGGLIKNYVHKDIGWDNANWNGTAMSYGDGDGVLLSPLVSIDVVGHEFSHAVVQHTAALVYQGESGALNESFADIFGTAIEFYGATSPNWTMGENIVLVSPYYMRSMSNPNSAPVQFGQQPDTYSGTYWANTSSTQDNGGVHTNSGVQNFWFYLLSQGGSGTNDISNSFTVTGIGITQATQIAYRNLQYYLTSSSNYTSSFYGSLQASQDLYGATSSQYNSVRAAWYAVGLGTNPSLPPCSGTTKFNATSGSFTDGSGSANYQNNLNCSWLIEPTGADSISLTFSAFRTEAGYDTVFVYNGPSTSSPLLMTWWGSTLPPTVKATSGAMLVRFSSDNSTTDSGWSASYITYGTSYCNGGTLLTSPSGSFTDGSGTSNYGNNSLCYWLIAPPCATSVTLSFSSFNTEANYDGVIVYNGSNTSAPVLLNTSGTTIPSNVTATSGVMLVVFVSDWSTKYAGFAASYTSTGTPYCSGTSTLNTNDYGTITDGSGLNNYCNNMDCRWLIQPPQATSVTLTFTSFKTEASSTDGFSIYDAVEVYDGTNTTAPLLGRFSGSNLPPSVTSTSGSMYIRFFSDVSVNDSGWSAYFTSTTTSYCSGTTILTTDTGSFNDGSGSNNYSNNASCKWLIQPAGASSISLSFTSFDTELNYDGIIVYDGGDTSATKLGVYTGNTLPPTLTSTGGSMLVWFLSDQALRRQGWNASYNSVSTCGSISKPKPKVGFTINNASQCLTGNSFLFTDTSTISTGTITRSWNFGDATNATNNPSNKTYGSANTYSVKLVSTSNYGCKDSITKTVTVNSQPSIPTVNANGATTFCSGGQVTLSTTLTGVNYQWLKDTINITGAISPSLIANTSGNYRLDVSNTFGCKSSSTVTIVNVFANPPKPTITINGNTLNSTATQGNQWFRNTILITGAVSSSYIPTQSGSYTTQVTNSNNCQTLSDPVSYTMTGINEIETTHFLIYPNPNDGKFKVESNIESIVNLEIHDVLGKQVLKTYQITKGENFLDVSELSKGVYMIVLHEGNNYHVEKLIIQ